MKHYMEKYMLLLPQEVDVLNQLPSLFEPPSSLINMSGKAANRATTNLKPPFLHLIGMLDANGDEVEDVGEASILLLEPLCSPLSRREFHACRDRGRVVLDLVNSLRILHMGHVSHNDIRPSNLMLHNSRGIIIDYGLAHSTEDDTLFATDLGRLVLVLMYWCTGNRAFAVATNPLQIAGLRTHMVDGWLGPLELALALNYGELVIALVRLVKSISAEVQAGVSPPDDGPMVTKDTQPRGEKQEGKGKGKLVARSLLRGGKG
jgi:hypothetical protein